MTFWKAMILGAVQGLTEFFPVSSSGHLAILQLLFGTAGESELLFDVLLHLGTLIAVILVFRKDVLRLITETVRIVRDLFYNLREYLLGLGAKKETAYRRIISTNYRKLSVMILIASAPTALLGALLSGAAEAAQFRLIYPGMGLFITGIFLLVVDMVKLGSRTPKDVPYWQALLVGIAQGFSVFPGISRSGATICSGLLCGLSRKLAIRFSFLLSIPAVIGAMIYELVSASAGHTFTWSIFGFGMIGAVMSGAVGFLCLKKMIVLVEKKKLRVFAYYCFAIGVIAMTCYFALGEA